MDRYPYLGTLYYLKGVYLRRIGTHRIFYRIFLIHITKYAYQVFGVVAEENRCFMLISILSASLVLQAFFYVYFVWFLILLFSFCRKFQVKITLHPIIELINALAHLEQQLRMRQLADEHQRRVTTQMRSQVWKPYASMDYAQYGGTLCMSNHNFGRTHHPNTSWNTSNATPHTPQVQRSSLDEQMAELARMHAELALKNAERSRPRAEMDYSQVRLPAFFYQNEESQPSHERMTKFEATIAELERVHLECEISKNKFMELTRTNVQIQPTLFKIVKEDIASMATSYTQLTFEKEQPKQEENMSIQELVAKYMKEQENMDEMSFEGQHESLPSTPKVNKEEESLSYNEEITSRDNEEHEKFQNVENDEQILETLVVNEEESTSPELQ